MTLPPQYFRSEAGKDGSGSPSKKKRKVDPEQRVHDVDSGSESATETIRDEETQEEGEEHEEESQVIKGELEEDELVGQSFSQDDDELEYDDDEEMSVADEHQHAALFAPPPFIKADSEEPTPAQQQQADKDREIEIPMFRYRNPILARTVVNAPTPGKRSPKKASTSKPRSSGPFYRAQQRQEQQGESSRSRSEDPQAGPSNLKAQKPVSLCTRSRSCCTQSSTFMSWSVK